MVAKSKKGVVEFTVRFVAPPGASTEVMREYVLDAVREWNVGDVPLHYVSRLAKVGGAFGLIGNPMTALDRSTVTVTPKRAGGAR